MERAIIHLNVADFAVAVERVVDARLRGRPVIIAPGDSARAVVYDMSEEAYAAGVRKGMAAEKAVRLCNDVCIRPPRFDRYEQAMKALLAQALPYSPLIETGDSDGHLFVDVTGAHRLFGPPADVAWRLRRKIRADLRLDPIWSVAPNKLVAKVATRLVKPTGEYIVDSGEEELFLAPLPVRLIPGIEPDDLRRLLEFNLTRAFQVTAIGPDHLETPFGSRARFIHDSTRGIDPSPVLAVGQNRPRVVVDCEFGEDANAAPVLEGALYGLIETAGRKLREQRRVARRIGIVIDYSDGRRNIRQASIDPATANDLSLFEAARCALNRAWTRRVRVRRLGLICDRLIFPPAQVELFSVFREQKKRRDDLIAAIDCIRSRFGHHAVRMGRTLAAPVVTP